MKFITMLPVTAGFFGALVAGAPFESKSDPVPLDIGTFCVFCEAVPSETRQSCYTHCSTITQNAGTIDDTVVLNTTRKASMAHSSVPVVSNTTAPSSSSAFDFAADTSGICNFCDSFDNAMSAACHMKCRKHAPMKAPWVLNALWEFCWDGCEMHNCGEGPWLASCILECNTCFGVGKNPQWPANFGPPVGFKWAACFCPMKEFAPQYQGDHDRYMAGETEDEDGFTVVSESESENENDSAEWH